MASSAHPSGSSSEDVQEQPSVLGILNDWDMASQLTEKGEVPNSAALHRTGTLPFMARDLLRSPPPPHYYRHDLESFFYILIWAAVHYDLENQIRKPVSKMMVLWDDQVHALTSKSHLFASSGLGHDFLNDLMKLMGKEFDEIKLKWILPLHKLFDRAFRSVPDDDQPEYATYDYETCNGQITFATFMGTIGIKPRSLEKGNQAYGSSIDVV